MNLKNIAKSKKILTIINSVLLLALLLFLIINQRTIIKIYNYNKANQEKAIEAAKPANLNIIVLQEPNCENCSNLTPLINAIKKENVKINYEKTVIATSSEGIKLIDKYNIKKAPTLIISGEIEKEAKLKDMWKQLGKIQDGVFVLEQVGAPYVAIDSGEVKGRIKLIMLTDSNCGECYDVAIHSRILSKFGLPTQNPQIINSQSTNGKKLIAKYKIKLLPTIILTGDVKSYPTLTKIWPKIGTIEKNGAYIFREGVKRMGTYMDLTANKIIKPVKPANNSTAN